MRRTATTLAILLLATAAMPGGAQQVPAELLEDGTGDVQVRGPDGTGVAADPTGQDALDLVSAGLIEDSETVTLHATVVDLGAAATTPSMGALVFGFRFDFGERGYQAILLMPTGGPLDPFFNGGSAWAALQEGSDESGWRNVESVDATIEPSNNQVVVAIPRALILDHDQAPLARGRSLDGISAFSLTVPTLAMSIPDAQGGTVASAWGPGWFDAVPDTGEGATHTMLTGAEVQRGDLFSDVVDPVRWTNGEATTLSYTVRLTNRGAEPLSVSLRITGADPTWQVAHSDILVLAAGESRNTTILVSIPFLHQHGTLHGFDAVFDAPGGHMASARLGVYWPRIPQPAGHHDTVWFHGAALQANQAPFDVLFPGVTGWFNAASSAVDDLDQGSPIPAAASIPPGLFAAFGGSTQGLAFWSIPMSPELRMGLDFDMSRTGSFSTGIDLLGPINDATVEAALVLRERMPVNSRGINEGSRTEEVLLAYGNASFAGLSSGRLDVAMEMVPTPDADLVEHAASREVERNLRLYVVLQGTAMVGTGFMQRDDAQHTIDPAATTMQLPLFEYRESVDLSFVTDRTIQLSVGERGQEREVNPGRSAVYEFTLDYSGDRADTFELRLSGTNAAWAEVLGDSRVVLQPGQPRTLALMVSAPDDARAGDAADVTLTATSTSNAAVQGGVRTLTKVVTARDIPDERDEGLALSGQLTDDKDSPGIGLAVLVGLVGAVLAARRRVG